jgi:hypothetical protein
MPVMSRRNIFGWIAVIAPLILYWVCPVAVTVYAAAVPIGELGIGVKIPVTGSMV